jgi:hypothetical protein
MKDIQNKTTYDYDLFIANLNLWNLIVGGSGKGLDLLRHIVDGVFHDNYSCPGKRMPSIIITGDGHSLVSQALINSLQIMDIRECHSHYLDNGINSTCIFEDSHPDTVHCITHIECLSRIGESVLWRYVRDGRCGYYNAITQQYDKVIHCNGMIVMTSPLKTVSKYILNVVDHHIQMEPYSQSQMKRFIQRELEFCGVNFKGKAVLDELVSLVPLSVDVVMKILKTCMVIMKAELTDNLTVKIVRKAKQYHSIPIKPSKDEIPF